MILLFEYKIWADSNHIAKQIIVTISSLLFYKDKKSDTNEIYLGIYILLCYYVNFLSNHIYICRTSASNNMRIFPYKLHNWFKVYISFMILYYICVISLPNWDINKIYRCTCLLWFNGFLHLRKFQNQPICFSSICIIRKMLKLFSEVHTQQQRQENM